MNWQGDQDAVARKLWLDGVDARTIGQRVGKTRMAVIGRADRRGWGPHPNAPEAVLTPERRRLREAIHA